MARDEIIEFLRSTRPEVAERFRARVEGIFGSVARGEDRPDSDLDVLVRFEDGASLLDLVALGDFLEEHLKRPVDIVSVRALRKEIQPYVERDLIKV